MSIFSLGNLALGTAGIAQMTAALARGDLDETARLGAQAGPVVVERALADPSRQVRLAAIVAAPAVEDRAELLPALARAAAAPDLRTAIPAAAAARTIARGLAARELADDLAPDDVDAWRADFERLARDPARAIEVRTIALDTAATLGHALDPDALGFDLAAALADPDPAIRATAVALVPDPAPEAARAPLAAAVIGEADAAVALGAAQALCAGLAFDDPAPVRAALGAKGLERIKALVAKTRSPAARDAARCVR
ncbi:MAG TPA: hypothetical protein VLX92_15155 [Kofleriaceae bacterium]|nr:hypothetical protein [Kofleriaceae bacterium]